MDIFCFSYNDIMLLEEQEKLVMLNKFYDILKDIPDSIYSDRKTIGEMLMENEYYDDIGISEYVFPGERVIYYPNIKYFVNKKEFTCSVSGQRVNMGNECVSYKPFLYLPKKHVCYVSKLIKAYYYYEDFFPKDLNAFEDFCYKVNHSYGLDLSEFYDFSCNIGGSIVLRKLKRR